MSNRRKSSSRPATAPPIDSTTSRFSSLWRHKNPRWRQNKTTSRNKITAPTESPSFRPPMTSSEAAERRRKFQRGRSTSPRPSSAPRRRSPRRCGRWRRRTASRRPSWRVTRRRWRRSCTGSRSSSWWWEGCCSRWASSWQCCTSWATKRWSRSAPYSSASGCWRPCAASCGFPSYRRKLKGTCTEAACEVWKWKK